ncbi:MAG TPA: TAXI family TRAP transporter solute-binding subunit [Rhizomicrobium sp.]|nr:TAXI family TRAP transporter solute-binding subunit [Rhizomicrobium sp.]
MMRRVAGWGGALLLAGFALVAVALLGPARTAPQRAAFVIDTGPTGGTYFPVGEAIAAIVSHPPGVVRCDTPGVCGPAGLIASARTSAGTIANIEDVNAHFADAALAQSDAVAEAVAGKGVFHDRQTHIRAMASLFPEEVHVVVRADAHIHSIAALRGRKVSVGTEDSGTIVTAREVLAAYRLSERSLKAAHLPADQAASDLAAGRLDGFFFTGGAPVPLVRDLMAQGKATLLPIAGAERKRLLKANPSLAADAIAAGTYPGTGATDTVAVRAVLIVNDQVPNDVVAGVTRALFNPANRDMLNASHPRAALIRRDAATDHLPAPLHPGAAHYYGEAK